MNITEAMIALAEKDAMIDELMEVVSAMARFDGRNNNSHLKQMAKDAAKKVNKARQK